MLPERATAKVYQYPLLLVVRLAGVESVAEGCPLARRHGVRAGMSLAQARALLGAGPTLCLPYEPEEDSRWLRRLAGWALRYTPVVALDAPDGLLMDIAGCQELFGGEERLLHNLAGALANLGLEARLAAAPTFGGAWALARYREPDAGVVCAISGGELREALAPLPIEALRIEHDKVMALREVGIERIAQLLCLPRRELGARFGQRLLQRLDQATGALPEQIETPQAPRRWEARREFDGPVTRPEVIEAATLGLLDELLALLSTEARGVCHLEITLHRVDQPAATLSIALTHVSRDAGHLARLIRARLERVHLGWGVEEISLRAVRTGRRRSEQTWLWAAAQAELGRYGMRSQGAAPGPFLNERERAALGEWLDRLRERAGAAAVRHARIHETHAPEQAFLLSPVDDVGALAARDSPSRQAGVCRADRPSRLLAAPEAARVISLAPDGPPLWLDWDRLAGQVLSARGPERIALPWWRSEPVAQRCARDYYQVQDEHGRWLWLFRSAESQDWFVHGVWA